MYKGIIKHNLSLVIPTYNEEANIHQVLERVSSILSTLCEQYEIIVVEDQSSDGTAQAVKKMGELDPRIRLIVRTNEKGLATVVVRGWEEARYDILGAMDGDLQHPPETLKHLMNAICDVDIAVASRNVRGGGVNQWSLVRRAISWCATLITTVILPETLCKVRDPMSGYFLLKRCVIKNVNFNPIGYKILLEILVKGQYTTITELPFIFNER